MIRTYHFTIDGAQFQLDLRAALGAPIFELLGPKYTQGGLIFSAMGALDLDDLRLHPQHPGLPWPEIEAKLSEVIAPDLEAWERACF